MRINSLSLALAATLLTTVATVSAQDTAVVTPSGQWVTDHAGLLSGPDEDRLTKKLRDYARTTSTQIVVVTVSNLGGAPIADYAVELGRVWKVGQAEHDNGAVILVAKNERKVFIATGYGLEGAIPDAVAGRIVRQIVTPSFKQGRFYEGISGAVDAMMAAASGEYRANEIVDETGGYVGGSRNEARVTLILVILVCIMIAIVIIRVRQQRRRNGKDDDDGDRGRSGRRRRRRRRYRRSPRVIVWGGGWGSGGGGGSFGGGGGGFSGGGGGFSGGGGSFGGGGAGGSW
ncbi:MAG: TPM domain-containing protein [Rhodothermales bacterium]|nr:TPM domain-containing protein [Rhodothermales bacterium]